MTTLETVVYFETTKGEIPVTVKGIYYPQEIATRNEHGLPMEPDYDPYFEIIEVSVNGIDYDYIDLQELLEMTAKEISDKCMEALHDRLDLEL